MRKISGNVVWTRPMSLSRAAKLLARFSAVDNGSSAAVSMYLQRASEAFDHLVQFHSKRIKVEENVDIPRAEIPPIDKKPRAVGVEDEVVQIADHAQEQEQRKEKKNKRRRDKEVDSNRKKRRIEVSFARLMAAYLFNGREMVVNPAWLWVPNKTIESIGSKVMCEIRLHYRMQVEMYTPCDASTSDAEQALHALLSRSFLAAYHLATINLPRTELSFFGQLVIRSGNLSLAPVSMPQSSSTSHEIPKCFVHLIEPLLDPVHMSFVVDLIWSKGKSCSMMSILVQRKRCFKRNN